jgi:hypothetical protein
MSLAYSSVFSELIFPALDWSDISYFSVSTISELLISFS